MKLKLLFLVVNVGGVINAISITNNDQKVSVKYCGITKKDDKILSSLGYHNNDKTELYIDQEAWDLPHKLGNTTVYIEEHEVDVPIGIYR